MEYRAPFLLFNAHLETIFPSLLRRVQTIPILRERIITPDEDFLDLDWVQQGARTLSIISHGLEGNSTRPYIRGMIKASLDAGMDALAWNFRGCSGEVNRQLRFYHSGATDDLDCVINHVVQTNRYDHIHLIGFSLGGNITLKYLGEERAVPSQIKKAVTFSVPLDLHSSCVKISQPGNRIYANRFLRSLKQKIVLKARVMPDINTTGIETIKTLVEFDDRYTAPLHGFKNAVDYYTQCSSIHFLDSIKTPTLLVNARNDPFLSEACYPIVALKDHPYIQFESPARGGHVGFATFASNGLYWSEWRAMKFLTSSHSS